MRQEPNINNDWNEHLWLELNRLVTSVKSSGDRILIIGNFNGHIEEKPAPLKPQAHEQPLNSKIISGEILDLCRSYDLAILNRHEKCDGTFTRMLNSKESAIDFVLSNFLLTEALQKMKYMTLVTMILVVTTLLFI